MPRYRYASYPDSCPPKEAYSPAELWLYRICKSDLGSSSLSNTDFEPVWEQKKRKFPKQQECGAKALSFFSDLHEASDVKKNYPNLGRRIVKAKLNEKCGVVLNTHKSHYNLWDYKDPGIINAIGDSWTEEG